jgi:molybdopterin-guanine dinucleotide biosynthesis protein MobB
LHIIAVVGSKHSGKTTTVEALVKGLVKFEYKVATVKHVSQKDFTMDTEGKDTWRHARAGATITTIVAAHEMAIIRKEDTSNYEINDIVKTFQSEIDIIIFEGFKKLIEKEEKIPKIVAVKNAQEASEAQKRFKPILAFVGSFNTEHLKLSAPYINILIDPEKLVQLVLKRIET